MNTREYEDQISTALVMLAGNEDIERVIGLLYMLRVQMKAARLEEQLASHREPEPKADLPPMEPLRPKVEMKHPKFAPPRGLRSDSPSLVDCPVCHAPKGYICLGVIGETKGKPLTGKQGTSTPGWHEERRRAGQIKRGVIK